MGDVPTFQVIGPIRCCWRRDYATNVVCGVPAAWATTAVKTQPAMFWCDVHRPPTAEPIAGELLVRRVSVSSEVVFCGTSSLPIQAEREAVDRLELAVVGAGGLLNLHAAASVLGRYTHSPARRETRGRPRRGY